jgi:asparagine synthase (glutamine-hydrolysing)
MHDPSGAVTVTYNGEIYNDRDLKPAITGKTGVAFRTTCDAEILAPGWLAWESALFARLEGMFALALWDSRHHRLVLARDHIGVKPLYYAREGRSIRFASEVKALLAAPDQPRKLSAEDLHRFLTSGYTGPESSLLEDVKQVPPGCLVIADRDGVRIVRFWKPARNGGIQNLEAAVEAFGPIWQKTVTDMLVSDVPVGLLLSGGIDSALIATELMGSGLPAFTAQFSGAWDESRYATQVANASRLPHYLVPINANAEVEATFKSVVHHLDGQIADSSCFPFFKVCQRARERVPVLMSGDGADEFFGGYETYRASRIASWLGAAVPAPVARGASRAFRRAAVGSDKPVSVADKLHRLFSGIAVAGAEHAHAEWRRYLMQDEMTQLYGPGLAGQERVDPLANYSAAVANGDGDLVDRCLLADQTYYLPADMLLKSDAMSMAHGLELRVPFLHPRIMEFAGMLDASLLTPLFGPDKRILRSALQGRGLGSEVTKRKKHGFNTPVAAMLRNGLRSLGDRLLDREADVLAPHLAPDGVRRMWREHLAVRADHGYALWTLLTLAVWKTYLNR